MNIENLDKSKIEQSIANENIRLDIVREKREKLFNELCRYKQETWFKIEEMTV
jgi:HD superfamily phosphohydrolase YqeK